MKKLTQEILLQHFHDTHNNTYDYSLVVYTNMRLDVTIICKEHGPFEQNPASHKRGRGCPDCGMEKQKIGGNISTLITQEIVIERFVDTHGDTYGYSLVKYIDSTTKVIIICKEHGPFEQLPHAHSAGKGCPDCYSPTWDKRILRTTYKDRPTTLYYVSIKRENYPLVYKIGLTMKNIKDRYRKELKEGVVINLIKEWKYLDGAEAFDEEQKILSDNKHFQYANGKSNILHGGNTELFHTDILLSS